MKITETHVKTICRIGQGKECCRYLTVGPQGFMCAKHTSIKQYLDFRVKNNDITAQGNNCDGYPIMDEGTDNNESYSDIKSER